jgi:hypothetical protein
MRAKSLLIGILGFIVAGVVFAGTAGDEKSVPPARDVLALQAATNIVFARLVVEQGEEVRFIVSDAKKIQELVSGIRLEPSTPLSDIHFNRAIFRGPFGEISVSFCPDCFTIHNQKGESVRNYTMPKDFYAAFQRLARRHGWKMEWE